MNRQYANRRVYVPKYNWYAMDDNSGVATIGGKSVAIRERKCGGWCVFISGRKVSEPFKTFLEARDWIEGVVS
jgi:hypothetical protein